MSAAVKPSSTGTIATLHPVFALTGVLHVIGGALLPSISARFHLSDSQSGLLFLLYFAGTSVGALLCRSNYSRTMTAGFAAMACMCLAVSLSSRTLLNPIFFLLGISVGVPMSAVTLFTGRSFPERCAPMLTFLNFSWSIGALAAPLVAARILVHHDYRTAYEVFSAAGLCAAVACAILLRDGPEPARPSEHTGPATAYRLVLVFAFAAFLQVGIENTVATWLPTYALRTASSGLVLAAASSSFSAPTHLAFFAQQSCSDSLPPFSWNLPPTSRFAISPCSPLERHSPQLTRWSCRDSSRERGTPPIRVGSCSLPASEARFCPGSLDSSPLIRQAFAWVC